MGTGIDITIKDLAKEIAKTIAYEGEITWDNEKPDGTPQKLLDVSKLSEMGWTSKIDLKKGLKDTFENFKQELSSGRLRV